MQISLDGITLAEAWPMFEWLVAKLGSGNINGRSPKSAWSYTDNIITIPDEKWAHLFILTFCAKVVNETP